MLFGIDIDGTIAGRNLERFKEECNRMWCLNIDTEKLAHMGYQDFMHSEQVVAYQTRVGAAVAEEERDQLEHDPSMLCVLPVLPDAPHGVTTLSKIGQVRYYTVRKHTDPEQERHIQEATRGWLCTQHFPHPDAVVFCLSVMNKLIRLYLHTQETKEKVVLIDDLYPLLLTSFQQLVCGDHPKLTKEKCTTIANTLKQQMILVAFGATSPPESTNGLQVAALPSWSALDEISPLFSSFEKGVETC